MSTLGRPHGNGSIDARTHSACEAHQVAAGRDDPAFSGRRSIFRFTGRQVRLLTAGEIRSAASAKGASGAVSVVAGAPVGVLSG
jgi:hypothetical protein